MLSLFFHLLADAKTFWRSATPVNTLRFVVKYLDKMKRVQGITSNTKDLQPKMLSIAMQIDTCPANETTTKPPGFKR